MEGGWPQRVPNGVGDPLAERRFDHSAPGLGIP